MLKNRKTILLTMLTVLVLSIAVIGCSNNNADEGVSNEVSVGEDKDNASSKGENIQKNDGLDKRYDDYIKQCQKDFEEGKVPEEIFNKLKENADIMKDLNRKANDYCGSGFYAENVFTIEGTNAKKVLIKEYWQEGNYRYEEYDDKGDLAYLEVYNKDEDTDYYYEAKNDVLKKTTNCTAKGKNPNLYEYGFFNMTSNAILGDFKTVDYNDKETLYSEIVNEGMELQTWYDAENGIILREEQKIIENGEVQNHVIQEYTVKPNQKFDKSVFQYDPNNKTVAQ